MRLALLYGRPGPVKDTDTVVYLGDAGGPEAVEALAGLGVPVYAVPGRRDDHYIAELMRKRLVDIEGKLLYAGKQVYIAGVGGREPLANVSRLLSLEPVEGTLVLVSYYPPPGVCDRSKLGVGRGVGEVEVLVGRLRPALVAVRGCCGCCVERGGVLYACLAGGCRGEAVLAPGIGRPWCRVLCRDGAGGAVP